ncbi:unnamed protein product [Cladocopium goreaui]|uniref:Uncharacterized protein n=1 Tax=Cladocopium goreaui TaxID=2562237 RepID=A0A9P1CLA2_9DINO|nr:unnamed protein product [Cladocopium goreaui]
MLGGTTRNADAKNLHTWHSILKVNDRKQVIFIQRVLLLHEIASKKGGRASTNRLSVSEWQLECDRCCLLTHILDEMSRTVDDHGQRLFPDDLLASLATRVVEGDYTGEADSLLGTLNPAFDVKESQIFLDNAPEVPDPVQKRMEFADERVNVLNQDARKAQFEADTLCLAKMPVVAWADMMKCGRPTNNETDEYATLLSHVLHKRPKNAVGVIIAPFLVSANQQGYRGQLRTWEDKMDAKSLRNESIAIRCTTPPAKRRVPIQFDGWIAMSDKSTEDNVFDRCQLLLDRATRQEIAWQAEANYVVPTAEKDAVPHASEGSRSLSDVQECAQYLAGDQLPNAVIAGLLSKSKIDGNASVLALVNLTPYDACVEKFAKNGLGIEKKVSFKSLSLTKNLNAAQYVERTLSIELLEEWKCGKTGRFGNVRPYEPTPPVVQPGSRQFDLSSFPLKLVKLDIDLVSGKKGWARFKVSLPPHVRSRHLEDPVYGAEWKSLMLDFDEKYGRNPEAERQAALIAKQEDDAGQKVEAFEPWDEPQTLEALQDKYIVECKFSGRCAGTTLVLCQSKKRDGVVDQVTGNQRFKLFMVAHCKVTVPGMDFQIAHGPSKFVKPEKVANLQRQDKEGTPGKFSG